MARASEGCEFDPRGGLLRLIFLEHIYILKILGKEMLILPVKTSIFMIKATSNKAEDAR